MFRQSVEIGKFEFLHYNLIKRAYCFTRSRDMYALQIYIKYDLLTSTRKLYYFTERIKSICKVVLKESAYLTF